MESEAVIVDTGAFNYIYNLQDSPSPIQLHLPVMDCRRTQSPVPVMGTRPLGYISIC
jgi:hypothetical protein